MHHSSPSTITYPSSPSSPQPHCSTTSTCPTPHLTALRPAPALLHPALLPSSLPYHLHTTYSTMLYYPPHCPTTSTRPTPPCSTTHLTASPPAPALLLSYLSQIRLPYLCAHCTHIYYCALTSYTYYPAHRTHVPHSTPPCPSPPQMYHPTPISYRLYHTALARTPLSSI